MKKEKRFLITTALENTWSGDCPVLFLGDWCRVYSQKNKWSKINSIVLPYHWDDRQKLHSDYKYLNSLYEKTLVDLMNQLNKIHKVELSLRYWRILIGPWLAYFIHILFDRWESISIATRNFELNTVINIDDQKALIPNDMNHFNRLIVNDDWNQYIFSEILPNFECKIVECINKKYPDLNVGPTKKNNFKKISFLLANFFSRFLSRDTDIFLKGTHTSRINELLLQFKLGQLPQFWVDIEPEKVNISLQKRHWVLPAKSSSPFETFLFKMIPKNIPSIFLEGYSNLIRQVDSLPWPKSPKVIYTATSLWSETVTMAYVAEKIESGGKLIYAQHGGGYGTAKFHFAEEHEIKISNQYLTWGWGSKLTQNLLPFGRLSSARTPSIKTYGAKKILLIITMLSFRYSYRLCAESAVNYEKYVGRSFEFVDGLNDHVFRKVLIRPPPVETGMNVPMRWVDRFPKINIDSGSSDITSLMCRARLVVHTYNQTGFLETIKLGIPTIIFFDPQITPLRESAMYYFNELKRVGVFHDTPESAAEHVNLVWDDIDAWWTGSELQGVINTFKNQYCQFSKDNINNIYELIQHECLG